MPSISCSIALAAMWDWMPLCGPEQDRVTHQLKIQAKTSAKGHSRTASQHGSSMLGRIHTSFGNQHCGSLAAEIIIFMLRVWCGYTHGGVQPYIVYYPAVTISASFRVHQVACCQFCYGRCYIGKTPTALYRTTSHHQFCQNISTCPPLLWHCQVH